MRATSARLAVPAGAGLLPTNGRGEFSFVADTGLAAAVPLSPSARPKGKSDRGHHEAPSDLVVLGTGSLGSSGP